MSSDVRRDFGHILEDYFLLCDAVRVLAETPSCAAVWDGEFSSSREFRDFYLRLFLTPAEAGRAIRAAHEVGRFFREINQRAYEQTGVPRRLPHDLIEELERRIVVAQYPSSRDVVLAATTQPAALVAKALIERNVTEAKWRKRYS